MVKIKACSMVPWSAVSFYRTAGPLSQLHRCMDVDVEFIETVRWDLISGADILFLERPYTEEFLRAIKIAKRMGVKVWADFDDDVFSVPSWNPAYRNFDSFDKLYYARECSRLADMITVTTEALMGKFGQYNDEVFVVPNAFNDYVFELPDEVNRNNVIMWRGSEYHREDLIDYFSPLKEAMAKIPDWEFHMVGGGDPWYIYKYMKSVYHPGIEIEQFYPLVRSIAPSVSVSILKDCEFNIAKSNIALIEGVVAGSCHIGPEMPEFEAVGGTPLYKNKQEFFARILETCGDEKSREDIFNSQKTWIEDNLLLSHINIKRANLVKFLANKNPAFYCDKSDVFIGVVTGFPKRYCDEDFVKNLSLIAKGNPVEIVDNTLGRESYAQRLKDFAEKYSKNIKVTRMEIEGGELFFQRAVAEGYSYLAQEFLNSDCEYFMLIESDVFPGRDCLNSLLKMIQLYDAVSGVYYPGHHLPEWFRDDFTDPVEVDRIFTGCSIYRRHIIEKYNFRYDPDEPREFPDTLLSRDIKSGGFTMAIDTRVVCDHKHDSKGGRGHNEVTL